MKGEEMKFYTKSSLCSMKEKDISATLVSTSDFPENTQSVMKFYAEAGRCTMKKDDIAGTIRAQGGAFSKNMYDLVEKKSVVRKTTPVECERLQGFPDDWTKIPFNGKDKEDCPLGARYKAIGNSMAVPVMEFIGRRIEALENALKKSSKEES